jgi:hypothetical protein
MHESKKVMVEQYLTDPVYIEKLERTRFLFEFPLERNGYFIMHKETFDEYLDQGAIFQAVMRHRGYKIQSVEGDFCDHYKMVL